MAKINQEIPDTIFFEVKSELNKTRLIRSKRINQAEFIVELIDKGLAAIKEENENLGETKGGQQ